MSTIVRNRFRPRPSGGDAHDALSPRAVRFRNACLRSAAAELRLPVPGDDELSALGSDVGLARALDWWRRRQTGVAPVGAQSEARRVGLLSRAAWITAVALLSLALSYGQVG